MAFYLRKHFKTGPLRLNLSKSGLGLSAGVTGARLGLGPKGAYVHGGRHGLYYRKYAPKGGGHAGSGQERREARFFVDTGLTYKAPVGSQGQEAPPAPVLKGQKGLATLLLLLGLVLAAVWFAGREGPMLVGGMVFLSGGVMLNMQHQRQRERSEDCRRRMAAGLKDREAPAQLIREHQACQLKEAYRRWLDFHVFVLFQDAFYEDPDYITAEELAQLESQLSLPASLLTKLKAASFAGFLDELLEDHLISHEEEQQLDLVQNSLRLSNDDIPAERHMIRQLCTFRDMMEAPLEAIEADMPLKRNELCYFQTEGRLLKEKIVHQYQRQGVVHKEIGYDIDMEGRIYLSSHRILIVGRGSRSYDIKRILDTTLSLEDHTLQLVLDGRKNPLFFSTPDLAAFAARLERIRTS